MNGTTNNALSEIYLRTLFNCMPRNISQMYEGNLPIQTDATDRGKCLIFFIPQVADYAFTILRLFRSLIHLPEYLF